MGSVRHDMIRKKVNISMTADEVMMIRSERFGLRAGGAIIMVDCTKRNRPTSMDIHIWMETLNGKAT